MRSSMKMRSNEANIMLSSNSPRRISNSRRSKSVVFATFVRSTSLTVTKRGVSVSMIQQLGEMLTSQSVNA